MYKPDKEWKGVYCKVLNSQLYSVQTKVRLGWSWALVEAANMLNFRLNGKHCWLNIHQVPHSSYFCILLKKKVCDEYDHTFYTEASWFFFYFTDLITSYVVPKGPEVIYSILKTINNLSSAVNISGSKKRRLILRIIVACPLFSCSLLGCLPFLLFFIPFCCLLIIIVNSGLPFSPQYCIIMVYTWKPHPITVFWRRR